MITDEDLNEKLKHWVKEYGPGGLPNERSYNLIQSLMEHKGFVPSSRGYVRLLLNTVGDEVESGVVAMECTPAEPGQPNICYRAAKVLRMHYLVPRTYIEADRIKFLGHIGLRMTRHGYHVGLQHARAFLAGYLNAGVLRSDEKYVKMTNVG